MPALHPMRVMKHLQQHFERWTLSLLTLGFTLWGLLFIYRSSFIAIDGLRYFSLFDDAMISMRYAWNFAHGVGLVWNPGEYVEGYTNLLMVLLMSLSAFVIDNKRFAVLAIQLAGILFMVGNAYLTMRIADAVSDDERLSTVLRQHLRTLAFFCTLAYYPLVYWSLMGMETGLVTMLLLFSILMVLRYEETDQTHYLYRLSLSLGLAYLTRPDALVPALIILAYLGYQMRQARKLKLFFVVVGLYLILPFSQTLFRWFYYGELVPNTYVLKIEGIPYIHRIRNGLIFIKPFLQTNLVMISIALLGVFFDFHRKKLLLAMIILATLGYQVWAGGDPWQYWRMLAPVMPLILMLLVYELLWMIEVLAKTHFFQKYMLRRPVVNVQLMKTIMFIVVVFLFVLQTNNAFRREIAFISRPYKVEAHRGNVDIAIALQNVTTPKATIGVIEAGVIPYYADRVSIDFLGKADKYIARLEPDLVQPDWFGMRGVVGHNKYDLDYSIKKQKPTYVQTYWWGQFAWGSQSISDWGKQAYAETNYKGHTLFFLKGSPEVQWAQLSDKETTP
ncbi:MAG: hypothetical protein AAF639_17110 [Chloroflexota bacterium]